MFMDLPAIIVVLVINRRTMKLKKILEKEKEKKQDELIVREIMAARQTNAIEKDYDPDDE